MVTTEPQTVRAIRILVILSTIPLTFAAAWWQGHSFYNDSLPGVVGFLVPEIVLTPTIVALALLRTSALWIAVTLAAALSSGVVGIQFGAPVSPEPLEIPPVLGVVLVFLFHGSLLALWASALTLFVKRIQKGESKKSLCDRSGGSNVREKRTAGD